MASERDERMFVMLEHIIEEILRPHVMLIVRLAMVSLPELILLGEAVLDFPIWKGFVDESPCTSLIASMLAHSFS